MIVYLIYWRMNKRTGERRLDGVVAALSAMETAVRSDALTHTASMRVHTEAGGSSGYSEGKPPLCRERKGPGKGGKQYREGRMLVSKHKRKTRAIDGGVTFNSHQGKVCVYTCLRTHMRFLFKVFLALILPGRACTGRRTGTPRTRGDTQSS